MKTSEQREKCNNERYLSLGRNDKRQKYRNSQILIKIGKQAKIKEGVSEERQLEKKK